MDNEELNEEVVYDEAADAAADSAPAAEMPEEAPQEEAPVEEAPKEPEPQVNLGALHQARAQNREKDQTISDLEQTIARLNDRTERILAAQQPQQPVEPEPTVDEDPLAVLENIQNTLKEQQELRDNEQAQMALLQQQQAQHQALTSQVTQAENAFRQANPDYDAAAQYAYDTRINQMLAMGYGHDEAVGTVTQEAIRMAQNSVNYGVSPAQALYDYSKQLGYQPATEKIQNAEKGQEAAKSLDSGGKSLANISAEDLGNMSDEDFDKHFAEVYGGS
tara:strand:- start:587 stop:1417 length:831 start_codon:yes stop_codon:yes gene_type:complete